MDNNEETMISAVVAIAQLLIIVLQTLKGLRRAGNLAFARRDDA